jgi:periplasmic protein TonB
MNSTVHTAEVLPPRAMLFLGIVALHAVLAYFFASSFTTAIIKILSPPMDAVIITDRPPPTPQSPPEPQPAIPEPAEFVVPEPILNIVDPEERVVESMTARIARDPVPYVPSQPPVVEEPIRLIGRNVMPNTQNYYPPHEIRTETEGATEVRACVDANGRLDGMPTVETSSGRASFDNAAVRVARDGRYARAMRGDTPVANCYRFRIIFSLGGSQGR